MERKNFTGPLIVDLPDNVKAVDVGFGFLWLALDESQRAVGLAFEPNHIEPHPDDIRTKDLDD